MPMRKSKRVKTLLESSAELLAVLERFGSWDDGCPARRPGMFLNYPVQSTHESFSPAPRRPIAPCPPAASPFPSIHRPALLLPGSRLRPDPRPAPRAIHLRPAPQRHRPEGAGQGEGDSNPRLSLCQGTGWDF